MSRLDPAPAASGPITAHDPPPRPRVEARETQDFFIEKNGAKYAGRHLLIDLYGGRNLNDPTRIEAALRDAAEEAGATVLTVSLHHFSPEGVTGVAILAESHMSIHTWPDAGYAAIDVFMCGECDPNATLPALKRHFEPRDVKTAEHLRGAVA